MYWNTLTHSVMLDPSFRLDGDLVGGEVGIRPECLGVGKCDTEGLSGLLQLLKPDRFPSPRGNRIRNTIGRFKVTRRPGI
jgi:hypothetical protein